MWGSNDKIPIKTPKILQNSMFWTFLTFLIFLVVTKRHVHPSRVLTMSQGFQKGIICGGTMPKYPSRQPKSSKTPCFGTFLTFLIFLMVTKSPVHPSRALIMSQGFQKGIICGVAMTKSLSRHPKSSKTPCFGHS